MRKVICYIAMSVDGYIAGPNDDLSFLKPFEGDPQVSHSFDELNASTDTMILGRKTYDVIRSFGLWPHGDKKTYVISHTKNISEEGIQSYGDDLTKLINKLKNKPGKDIWLVGGGALIKSFHERDLVDEYQIAIAPTLLGEGTPLFLPSKKMMSLKLVKSENLNGLILLTYQRA